MKVILKENVYGVGSFGQTVDVKPGFARNYLLPKDKALLNTKPNQESFESMRAELETRLIELTKDIVLMAEKVVDIELLFERKAAEDGKLYGSVTSQDIAKLLAEDGIQIPYQQIVMAEHRLHQIGEHEIQLCFSEEHVVPKLVTVKAN